jgi:hypothetical protein
MANLTPEEQKAVIKDALKEWLDDAFSEFGKWTVKGLLVAAFGGCVYLALISQGWRK